MNNNEAINIIDEQKPEYAEAAFKAVVPEFSFSVNGTQVVVRVKAIVGADSYELYQSEKPRSKYTLIVKGSSPIIEFYVPNGKSYHYRLRACHGTGADIVTTEYSKPQYIDLVTASKVRDERMDNFFNALKDVGVVLSFEDLDIAIESLKVAGLEAREKENRRKLEEQAEKRKKEIEAQNKRRQAVAKRAAARREKKRIEHVNEVTRIHKTKILLTVFLRNMKLHLLSI